MERDRADVQVLIVDDQGSFRRAARRVVELTPGFCVAGDADSGEAAIKAALEKRLDLVLMDVHLPGISGLQAARHIRAASHEKRPVILLMSTDDAAEYGERLSDCGAAAYLSKAEFGSEQLASAWAAVIACA